MYLQPFSKFKQNKFAKTGKVSLYWAQEYSVKRFPNLSRMFFVHRKTDDWWSWSCNAVWNSPAHQVFQTKQQVFERSWIKKSTDIQQREIHRICCCHFNLAALALILMFKHLKIVDEGLFEVLVLI